MSNSQITKKKLYEEEEQDNTAASVNTAPVNQSPPAPQPVEPSNNSASTTTSTPVGFFPPQPGMIPTGWMFPQDYATSAVMNSGDVNMAATGTVDGQPITNEEAQVVTEYRKWRKTKKLEALKKKLAKRISEDEDEFEPEAPVDGTQEYADQEEFSDEEEFVDEEKKLADVEDELKDIAIDINSLFADLGGDIDEVLPDNPEAQAREEMEYENLDTDSVDEMEETREALRKRIRAKIAQREARRRQESESELAARIKFPPGTPEPEASPEEKIQAYERKIQARRKLLAELRRRRLEQLAAGEYSGPDEDEDSVDSIIDDLQARDRRTESHAPQSAIMRESLHPHSSKFFDRYKEKKALNFRELLERGLLG